MDELERKPTPGSDDAIKRGCTCPEAENRYGEGVAHFHAAETTEKPDTHFCIAQNCQIHGFRS